MIVSNRKLFKKRPARDNLNQAAGIMASSPELMGEVQGFDNGGNVQLPGSVGSIVQMLDTINELPEIVVKGIKSKFSPKTPVNPIQEVPVIMPNGEPGFAIYENGELKGYTSSPSSKPMIKDRSRQVDEIASEVRPPVNVSSTSISNLLRGLVGADKGKSEAVQEFEEAKERGELGIQDSRLLEMLGGRGGYAEKGLTGILRLVPELQEFVGDLSGSALGLLGKQTDETKLKSVGSTLPGVNYRSGDFPGRVPTDTPFKVLDREGFRGQEAKILEELGPAVDMEDPNKNEIQAMLERIQKGQEDTERMKGPVAPTTSLSSRVEKVKAERDAFFDMDQRAILAGQAREKFFDPLSVEKFLEQRPIATEIGGEDPRVDLPPGAFPKADKQVEELNNIVSENKKYDGDNKTFDAMGDLDTEAKQTIVNQTNNIVETTTGSNLDQLMKEFIGKAPEYEGISPGLARMKIGFAIAAGKSADGIQNIADGLSLGADILIKDKSEKDAFNRQVKLSALQYGLGELSKERAQARVDARTFNTFIASKDVTWNGTEYKAGTPIEISNTELLKNGLPKEFTKADVFLELETAITERQSDFNEALQKAYENNIIEDAQFDKRRKTYSDNVSKFVDATVGGEYLDKAILMLADEDQSITGLKGAGKTFLRKLADAIGVDVNESYKDQETFRKNVKIGFQKLITTYFKSVQSANSISNFDVTQLADAFIDAAILDGGTLSFTFKNPEILISQLQQTSKQFKNSQRDALAQITSIEEELLNRYLPGGTITSPRSAMEPLSEFRERLDPFLGRSGSESVLPVFRGDDGIIRFKTD